MLSVRVILTLVGAYRRLCSVIVAFPGHPHILFLFLFGAEDNNDIAICEKSRHRSLNYQLIGLVAIWAVQVVNSGCFVILQYS